MDTFKINIVKTPNSFSDAEYQVYTNRGREFLFFFYRSETSNDLWYFHLPENSGRELFITSEPVPADYLLKLAKAVITIRYGVVDFDASLTVEAKKTLGIK